VPLNPCGRVTDFARREYRTKVRFFKDSDQEVDVQVYRAAPGAPRLGFPSAFMSLDWLAELDEPWETHLGEVWGEPRPYSFHGPLIDVTYDHVCGTAEQFRDGVEFDPTRNVKYDDQGLPECCGGPLTAFLGIEFGLEVEVTTGPGPTCPTAAAVFSDVDVVGPDGPSRSVWYRWEYPGGNFQIPYTSTVPNPPLNYQLYVGDTCETAVPKVGFTGFPAPGGTAGFFAADFGPPNTYIWMHVPNAGGGNEFTFRFHPL
jgi:hypothetical protein